MTHRSLLTIPVTLLATLALASPVWAGEDDGDDPVPAPVPTAEPVITPAPTPPPVPTVPPVVPVPTVAPVQTVVPTPVPTATPHKAKKKVHHERAKAHRKIVKVQPRRRIVRAVFVATPVATPVATVVATPSGGVQAGAGGTADGPGGPPLTALAVGMLVLFFAGRTLRAALRR
jgi:outer membrane biosynthesis protein TonB